jgi:glycerophosphoryl diester phosphodiesterase
MLVIAHRGFHVETPENTLEAFDAAVAVGANGIETDVRLSADGRAVLFHDRIAPDGRPVAAQTHDELCAGAGYWVPTLDSALARHADVLWMLEVKEPAAATATADLVRQYGGSRRFILTSFWHNVVEELVRLSAADCGVIVCHRPVDPESIYPGWPAAAKRVTTIVWNWEFLDADALDLAARSGLASHAYGVQTREDHERARRSMLDGIITDRPDWLTDRPGRAGS